MHQNIAEVARPPRRRAQPINWERLSSTSQTDRALRREMARADRTGRGFSLVLFRVNPGPRHQKSTRRLARALLERARLTDEVGWFSDNRYLCAMLTETEACGARIFAERVCDDVSRRSPRPLAIVYSYPRVPAAKASAVSGATALDGNLRSSMPQPSGANSGGAASALKPMDLASFVQAGFADPSNEPAIVPGSVQELLLNRLPAWKRALDVAGACFGIIVLAPLMAVVALCIRLTSPGPIIFRQLRSGLGGKPFIIYKFRTMISDAEALKRELRSMSEQDGPAFKIANDPRITRLGRLLRKTSADELPQLFNVLKGDMSLVGPRPLPCDESDECLQWQRHRLDVTPGLTCIWQIEGRSRVTFDEWVRMDVAYMRRVSPWRDLAILLKTVPAVLLRRGAR